MTVEKAVKSNAKVLKMEKILRKHAQESVYFGFYPRLNLRLLALSKQ